MGSQNSNRVPQRRAYPVPWRKWLGSVMMILVILFSTACSPTLGSMPQTQPIATTAVTVALPATGNEPAQPTKNQAQATVAAAPAQAPTATAAGMPGMGSENTIEGQVSAIKVSDQPLNNGAVNIDLVTSKGPGWVVVYTLGANGQPDQPIGQTAVKAGVNHNVAVQVDEAKASASSSLYAQLHVDKGVAGTFEFPGADEPVMVGAQMIAGTFKVTQAVANNPAEVTAPPEAQLVPNIIVANQPIKDGKVVIPQVDSIGEAWLVIHKQNGDGSMGPMAGFAHLVDGVNKNVAVPLDTNSTSTIMYAMLHHDLGVPNRLEFPGADEPVLVNNQMIAPTFEITSAATADVVVTLGSQPETAHSLVDGRDMSLYISLRDTPGKSACTGDCVKAWVPLAATGRIVAGSGVDGSKLGVILRPDGIRQVTYMNQPLYLFSKDTKPGDVKGQGFDGTYYLVNP